MPLLSDTLAVLSDVQADPGGRVYLLYATGNSLFLARLTGLLPTLTAAPSSLEPGGTITLRLRVDNLESQPVTNVAPGPIIVGGSGGASLLSGPSPATAMIPPGGAQTFDFTFAATSPGTVTFTGSASGTNSTGGLLTTPSVTSAPVQIQAAPTLVITTFRVGPASVNVGGTINVNMAVSNTGSATATAVTPSALTLSNPTFATLAAGPSPQTIAGGGSATFFWTFTATNAGILSFTGAVTGTDALSGAVVSSLPATSNAVTVTPPPATITSLSANPSTALVGQSVSFTVNGTGTCGSLTLAFGDSVSTFLSGTFPLTATHAYSSAGTFTPTATGATSCTGSASAAVTATSPPTIGKSPPSLSFTAIQGGINPAFQTLNITNTGSGTLTWSVSGDAPWLSLSPTSGSTTTGTNPITVSVNTAGLAPNTYSATITITAPGATNTPQTVPVTLTITPSSGLTVALLGTGTGTVTSSPAAITCPGTCTASFPSGTTVTLTAAPTGGSTFSGWGGDCAGQGSPCTLTMSAPKAVTATFTPPPLIVSPTAVVALNGATFRTGQTIAYQATLTPGSVPVQVDIYLGVLLPDGVTFLSLVPVSGGFISIALGPSPIPFRTDVALTPTVVPFSYAFQGLEPVGTYFTYAGLVVAGGHPLQLSNQLSVAVQAFQFSP